MKKIVVLMAAWILSLSLNPAVSAQEKKEGQGNAQSPVIVPVVVFVCEHGAAKSILSAALFNKLARERNLDIRAIARGTNPDPEIAPKVARGLQADGLTASESAPKLISQAELVGV